MDAGARASMLPSGEEPASAGSLLAAPHCCLGGTLRGFVLLGGCISPMAAERGKRKLGCSDTGLERDARFIAWRPSRHPRLAPRLRVVRRAFVPAPLGGGISSSPAVCKTPAAISYSTPLPYHAASDGIIPPAGRSPPAHRAAGGSPASSPATRGASRRQLAEQVRVCRHRLSRDAPAHRQRVASLGRDSLDAVLTDRPA